MMGSLHNPSVPQHVAIIMDGNGRWAKKRGLLRTAGHKQGIESVRRAMEAAQNAGVHYLTLFVFSAENWQRSVEEVGELMGLLRFYLKAETAKLHAEGVRLHAIGDKSRLPQDVVELLDNAEAITKENSVFNLVVAVSYGARQEMVAVARTIAEQVKTGALAVADINEDTITQNLWTKDLPMPDLIVRTGGEHRLSNFLLWQAAYAELVFLQVAWPDFKEEHFKEALAEYTRRERRYGHAVETVA